MNEITLQDMLDEAQREWENHRMLMAGKWS